MQLKSMYILLLLFFVSSFANAAKDIYIPKFITDVGMDLNNSNSQWCYSRSVETENCVIFWEPGFGADPTNAPNMGKFTMNLDLDGLKGVAEKSYTTYVDSVQMVVKGSSVTDAKKLLVFVLYDTNWGAWGSGQDDLIGTLHVTLNAANIPTVVAHEIGHCFEYLAGCDAPGAGFRLGFGPNGEGGNGFWEQIAQWLTYQVFPDMAFQSGHIHEYMASNHLHIIHETPRYANYFIGDYWLYKRGPYFMGELWRAGTSPEDPIEIYKKLTSVSQETFNDEMYEHGARLTTWDLPKIKENGKNFITSRSQVKMNLSSEKYWVVDKSVCIENYGYNSIKLNVPAVETEVSVNFRGLAGDSRFRSLNIDKGGWRFGFVALLYDGTRVYSDMVSAKVNGSTNPNENLSFTVPNGCDQLWLVVTGAPQEHWRHMWDDDNTNDEQWGYEVQFSNTNLLGNYDGPISDETVTIDVTMLPMTDYTATVVNLNSGAVSRAFALPLEEIVSKFGNEIKYYGVNPDGSLNATSTAHDPGHWFNKSGVTIDFGNNPYVYSELNINSMVANIGQSPNSANIGDKVTIKQALVYQKSSTEKAQVTFVFNVTISDNLTSANVIDDMESDKLNVYPNPMVANGIIAYDVDEESMVKVYDINGSAVATFNVEGKGTINWNKLGLNSKGIYSVVLKTGKEVIASKTITFIDRK